MRPHWGPEVMRVPRSEPGQCPDCLVLLAAPGRYRNRRRWHLTRTVLAGGRTSRAPLPGGAAGRPCGRPTGAEALTEPGLAEETQLVGSEAEWQAGATWSEAVFEAVVPLEPTVVSEPAAGAGAGRAEAESGERPRPARVPTPGSSHG